MDCSFCEKKISKGTEFIYVTPKGKGLYFCSSKCYRNMVFLKRKPRAVKWTKAYKVEKDARLKLLSQKTEENPKKTDVIEPQKGEVAEKSTPKVIAKKTPKTKTKEKKATTKKSNKKKTSKE